MLGYVANDIEHEPWFPLQSTFSIWHIASTDHPDAPGTLDAADVSHEDRGRALRLGVNRHAHSPTGLAYIAALELACSLQLLFFLSNVLF